MSVHVSAAVWDLTKAKGGALTVMLAIADVCGHDGAGYISVSTIAKKCRLTVRQVYNVLKGLEQLDELEIYTRGGKDSMNLYWVKIGTLRDTVPAHVLKARAKGKQVRNNQETAEENEAGSDNIDGENISPSDAGPDTEIHDTDTEAHFSKILKPTSDRTSITSTIRRAREAQPHEGPLREALDKVRKQLGEPTWQSWFKDVAVAESPPVLTATTSFMASYIRDNYGPLIETFYGGPVKIGHAQAGNGRV